MRVRAINRDLGEPNKPAGFDGVKRRYDGEVFDIPDHLFSETWMEKIDTGGEKRSPGRPPKAEL